MSNNDSSRVVSVKCFNWMKQHANDFPIATELAEKCAREFNYYVDGNIPEQLIEMAVEILDGL